MITALNRCFGSIPNANVRCHDSAGDVGHAAGHYGHEFRVREIGKKWPDGHRRFCLPHEDAGRDIERFRAAGAHHSGHDPGRTRMMSCMMPIVIKHGEKRADENNRRQHLKSENRSRDVNFASPGRRRQTPNRQKSNPAAG